MLARVRLPSPPPATGEPLAEGERWDLFDLPDLDEILYPTWEALLLHRIQKLTGVVLGLAAVLSPWYWLAIGALVLYLVIERCTDAISIRSKHWIDRTPMDREYCEHWLTVDRLVGAYGLLAMVIVLMVRFG